MTNPQAAGVDAAVLNFDLLPDSAYVSVGTLASLLGVSDVTIRRRIADGILPPPVGVLGLQRYNVGEIRSYLKSSVAPAFAFDTAGAGIGQGAFSKPEEVNGNE
ncbi:AlpA family transcriptional regulator [Paraburkholderia sp. BL25I1N1]|uniref:helix-turn-helix transcriptional regulator n=1 Tax=Paraburkholderia sp. BL25I1N1 TaxID=1938804 RepID=UPI000D4596E0|nr:helix-turn-helix domain-containing protein [Paraburkholderia sp. BL25I1N1]PRY03799.1 DeoR-like protein with HTH domain [Paraburkholderia sp. BL25I1N1]